MSMSKLCDSIMQVILNTESHDTSEFFSQLQANQKKLDALAFLESSGYISVHRSFNGKIMSIRPEAQGKAYFVWKAQRRREKWLDRLYGFLSGVAVTVIGGLIVQWLAG